MKKTNFRSTINYDYTKEVYEKSTEPSMTVPDQSLTIDEILKRYASGRSVNVQVYDDYSGDDDRLTGVDIRTMDLSEVHDLFDVTKKNLDALQLEKNRRLQEKRDAELEASIIAKYEARKKDQASEQVTPKFIQMEIPVDKTGGSRPTSDSE